MTLLKQFIVKGIALSLICIATLVEAIPVNVTNASDLAPPALGSLRAAVNSVNAPLSLVDEIRFNAGFQINLASTLPTFTRATVEIDSRLGLKIHKNNDITQTIFDVAAGSELHLVENTLGGNSSWFGGMSGAAGAVIRLEEQQSLTYPGGFSGAASVICQGAGQTRLSGQSTGNLQLADGGGGVKIPTGGSWDGPVTIGATALEMNGGTVTQAITGNGLPGSSTLNVTGVFTPMAAITDVDSINVAAGQTLTVNNPITGYTGLTVGNGGSVVLNNGGNLSNGITLGNSIFTFNGGSYSGDVVGAAGSIMNVNSTLTAPGAITADTLNINPGGVFTPSVNVTINAALNVLQGGTLLLTNDLGGVGTTVDNAGTITHNTNAIRTIAGDFTQEQTGILNIGITNAGQYSQFQVNGNTILSGGVMNVQLLSGAQIANGTIFDIITSTGVIAGGAILPTVPKPSLFLSFRPVITGNRLQLIASRSGCMCINTVPALDGIAKKMDDLSGSNNFQPLLDILTQQTSQKAFENKLEQLAPTGLNGIHTAMAQGSGGAEQVLLRLDAVRTGTGGALARAGYARTGYAAGDVMEDRGSFGPILFGNSTKQSSIQGLSGYNAVTAGFGFLGDAPISEHFCAGLGASYANSVVRQSNNTGSHTTIGSTQGMAYGSATYGRLFLDAVLSAGINNYHGKRSVSFMGPTATSRYNGFQYGAKVKTGFAIPCYRVEVSPMAAVQYMHLNVGQYTEQGAGTLNQHLSSMQASTVRVNLGGKIAERSQEGTFFPELHAFYITDVKNPQVIITSRFVAGGGSFNSTSVVAPKHGVNLGASVTALISDDFTLSGGYDLEAKRSFRSHSASLKFKFLF